MPVGGGMLDDLAVRHAGGFRHNQVLPPSTGCHAAGTEACTHQASAPRCPPPLLAEDKFESMSNKELKSWLQVGQGSKGRPHACIWRHACNCI